MAVVLLLVVSLSTAGLFGGGEGAAALAAGCPGNILLRQAQSLPAAGASLSAAMGLYARFAHSATNGTGEAPWLQRPQYSLQPVSAVSAEFIDMAARTAQHDWGVAPPKIVPPFYLSYAPKYKMWVVSKLLNTPPFVLAAHSSARTPDGIAASEWQVFESASAVFDSALSASCVAPTSSPTPSPTPAPTPFDPNAPTTVAPTPLHMLPPAAAADWQEHPLACREVAPDDATAFQTEVELGCECTSNVISVRGLRYLPSFIIPFYDPLLLSSCIICFVSAVPSCPCLPPVPN
jgi:hypothetical protein